MALTSEDVTRLAGLARIDLTPDELALLAPQLDVIVEAVAGVAIVADEDIPPLSHPLKMINVMRGDDRTVVDDAFLENLAADAPAWQDDMFVVPRILEEQTA